MHTGGGGGWYRDIVFVPAFNEPGKSEEEIVGRALGVDCSAPSASEATGASGYPAAPPCNGLTMFRYVDEPGRFSLDPSLSTVYRIGRTLTGGASGGGWFRRVGTEPRLVSDTSIGPADGTWLAGPQVGEGPGPCTRR